jgi:hypothetical protein
MGSSVSDIRAVRELKVGMSPGDGLACYHWCPERAVQTRVAQKGYFYRSPEVTLEPMLQAAGGWRAGPESGPPAANHDLSSL